jgi:hypothetical protein
MMQGIFAFLLIWAVGMIIIPAPARAALEADEFKQYLDSITQPIGEIVPSVSWQVLAKAEPDECFYRVGDSRNTFDPGLELPCPEPATAKVNQAYVWGMAKSEEYLWFGTGPNVLCLVMGNYFNASEGRARSPYVCEYGDSQFLPGVLPAQVGDWRPPLLYSYNLKDGALNDIGSGLPGQDLMRLQMTVGIRSAGTLDDVVFFGGPALNLLGGINLFAFNARDGGFLGSTTLSGYNNIRKWAVAKGVLYTTVGTVDNSSGIAGKVLRWDGSAANPLVFTEVGNLDGSGAEIAFHDGRLFVATWPGRELGMSDLNSTKTAGLWMSPPLPQEGLAASDVDKWTKVWQVSDYEPDEITAKTYGGGAIASFKGYLYWGTMHVPYYAGLAHRAYYRDLPGYPTDRVIRNLRNSGTFRAISIFRGRNFGTQPEIELLYGESTLPKYTQSESQAGEWSLVPNNMGGAAPLFGHSGFGNRYNNYTWSMAVYRDELYVGTMDSSYILGAQSNEKPWNYSLGADLYRFPDAKNPAVPEDINGIGNYLSYGIRNMVAADDALYLGIANPMNLMTDPDDGEPDGGWELIKVTGGKSGGGGGLCSTARAKSGSPILLVVLSGLILFGLLILRKRK